MKTDDQDANRFNTDARRYAAYLETPEGRLRADLTFANLLDFISPNGTRSLHALDLGCGTGAMSVRLAQLGVHVTAVDSSDAMLELAQQNIADAGVGDKITVKQHDARKEMFPAESFDIVLCHNLLEYMGDPEAVLRGAVRMIRRPSGVLSLLARNQAGEVMKSALREGDLASANANLDSEWTTESLYRGKVRLFRPEPVEEMMTRASLEVIARRGVRVLSDYLPATISRSTEYERIFALERELGLRREFYGVSRYLHVLARSGSVHNG